MFYDFQTEYVRNYRILRDYLEITDSYKGIRFLLSDVKTGEILTKLVLLEDIENGSEWKKTKVSKQADFVKIIIEEGDENSLVEEVGKAKKKGMFDKEIKVDVKQYKYYLKKKD